MRFTAKCISEEDRYIIDNYGKLPNEIIATHTGLTHRVVIRRAAYLRKKGESVARYPVINWKKDRDKRSKLMEIYGTIPTYQVAIILETTVQAIHRAVVRIGIDFHGNDGCYTFLELAQILKIDETTIRRWTNFGLKIRGFAKDGCTNPRTPRGEDTQVNRFHALISLSNLKKF